ncbi:MAG: N-acetyl-gamma-glutamyl-phosphate reductase [Clostridium sp.]|jgi:N-acetyl-gamma-glutamyl-phosphate reductase|nr:N-acetyl-gamma-glutamyl-phosphate reductase [Clostridium sp.]
MKKVFIDGSAGTTGLRIRDRLAQRDDIKLIELPEEKRKDTQARRKALNSSDISFLCLPDAAAIEAAELVENENTVILDTSTAHRTAPGWAYGFPELSAEFEAKIISSKRIAVPGCHASGFIALVYPLIEAGLLGKDALLSCTSLTGYSGGGKKMIAEYEGYEKDAQLFAPRQYGTSQQHKHLKEMKAVCGIEVSPIFCPIVDDYYSGMEVTVPIFARQLKSGGIEDIKAVYTEKYNGPVVTCGDESQGGFLSASALSGTDGMKICVYGNEERILLTAIYDNLGKGASGAALECMNLVLGKEKNYGLSIKRR